MSSTTSEVSEDAVASPQRLRLHSWTRYLSVVAMFLVTGVVSLAIRLLNLPVNRVIEARYCKMHYLKHDPSKIGPSGEVPEHLCKIQPVQEQLVWLESAIFITLTVCDIVAAVPLSSVSDRVGRRPIIFLNIVATIGLFAWLLTVGKVEAIPVEAMLLAPLTSLFGGSDTVYQSVILAYLSDAAPDTETRTKYFSWLMSMSYVFSLLGPVLASATMSASVWLPFYLGLGLLASAIPLTALLSNGRDVRLHSRPTDRDTGATSTERTQLLDHSATEDSSVEAQPKVGIISKLLAALKDTFLFIIGKPNFQQILIITLLLGMTKSSMEKLVIYMSNRYHRRFDQVGYFLSVKAAVNIALLIVIVPALLRLWLRQHPGRQITADFLGLQTSLSLLCIGTLCLGLAGRLWFAVVGLMIYGFGTAATVFLLSLVKSSAISSAQDNVAGRDMAIVIIAQTIGTLAGTPLFAGLWVLGLKAGGVMLGLPYFVAALLNAMVLALVIHLHRQWMAQVRRESRLATGTEPDLYSYVSEQR